MPGPNKESPLLFLTLCWVYVLIGVERRWNVAAARCIPVCLVRDGCGLLVLLLTSVLFMQRDCPRIFLVITLFWDSLAAVLYLQFSVFVPALVRNHATHMEVFKGQVVGGEIATYFLSIQMVV
jgi:hypothetical protein